MSQTPSIGRIVHYKIPEYEQPLPAVIMYTNTHIDPEDTDVGLFVMSPRGGYTMEEIQQGEGMYQWNWPPFVPFKKPDPKPVPTKDDVELILTKKIDVSDWTIREVALEIMDLFEDFLK